MSGYVKFRRPFAYRFRRSCCLCFKMSSSNYVQVVTNVRDQAKQLDIHLTKLRKQNLELLYKSERLVTLLTDFVGKLAPNPLKLCAICCIHERNRAFSCGHLCCRECCEKVLETNPSRCPTCRAEVRETLRIFL